jgi:hypothetical protein
MAPQMYVCTCNTCFPYLVDDTLEWNTSRLFTYNKAYEHRKSQKTGTNSQLPFLFGVLDYRGPFTMIKAQPSDLDTKPSIAGLMERARGASRQRTGDDEAIGAATGGAIAVAGGDVCGVHDGASGSADGGVIASTIESADVAVDGAATVDTTCTTEFLAPPNSAPSTPHFMPEALATPMAAGADAGTSTNHGVHTPASTTPASAPATPRWRNLFPTPLRPLTPELLRPILEYGGVQDVHEDAQVPGDGEDVVVDDVDEEDVVPYHDIFDQEAENQPRMVTDAEEASKKLTPGKCCIFVVIFILYYIQLH